LETATAKRMSDSRHRQEAYEAFGVLWRLTGESNTIIIWLSIADDSMLPGEMFNIPIFMIVESLNDHDPIVRQLADSWMRSNLQSYTRILDPVLSRLLASNSDLVTTRYLFDVLSTILRTGGESVRNICKTTEMSQSLHPTIVKKAEEGESLCGAMADYSTVFYLSRPHDRASKLLSGHRIEGSGREHKVGH
jgi:hypothetical protein